MKTSRELIEKHCGRGLNERLVNIELSREGMPNYVWEGCLKNRPNGRVVLALESKGSLQSLFLREEAGTVVPDQDLFTLRCKTESGSLIELSRLYPQDHRESPFSGLKIDFEPHDVVLSSPESAADRTEFIVGAINPFRDKGACCFGSPLSSATPFGSQEAGKAWFLFERGKTIFALGRTTEGFREFGAWTSSEDAPDVRTSAKGFLYGLSFYVGERVDWLGFHCREGGRQKVCLKQPVPARTALLHCPRPSRICEADERSFLSCAFDYFVQPHNLPILNWLAMIWDSADNFFSIQCLVAATVVEGLARRIVGEEWNEEERESADALKQKVTDLVQKNWATLAEGHLTAVVTACHRKIPNAIKYAGGYSARELVKEAARKLGAPVTGEEIDAWISLRNPLAHGDYGSDRPRFEEIQATSRQLDCTVNLFYKLVYGQIGYKGPFVDFSRNGWPVSDEEADAS